MDAEISHKLLQLHRQFIKTLHSICKRKTQNTEVQMSFLKTCNKYLKRLLQKEPKLLGLFVNPLFSAIAIVSWMKHVGRSGTEGEY
jgi:hypothetical protein